MSRLPMPSPDAAHPEAVQQILGGIKSQFGAVPNVVQMMSTSPTVLSSILTFQMSLGGVLDAETRNAIALAVSEADNCTYCRNLHAYNAVRFASTSTDEISRNMMGESSDAKRAAAATFAGKVVRSSGHVTDVDLAAVRDAGYTDAEVLEIIAWSVAVLATNFINNVAETEVDLTAEMAAHA